jgi:hypothetical protein
MNHDDAVLDDRQDDPHERPERAGAVDVGRLQISLDTPWNTPRMMKMQMATLSAVYGKTSAQVLLMKPSRSWISKMPVMAVTRVGKKSEATSTAEMTPLKGVGR